MATTVSVACKMPSGLILRLFRMEDYSEPVMGGGTRTSQRAVQVDEPVRIHGVAVPFGRFPRTPIIGGYAITPNVDAEFFAEWLKQNAEHDVVKNNLIFTHDKPDFVEKRARDNEKRLSGLEPLNPEMTARGNKMIPVDPRFPRGIETGAAA